MAILLFLWASLVVLLCCSNFRKHLFLACCSGVVMYVGLYLKDPTSCHLELSGYYFYCSNYFGRGSLAIFILSCGVISCYTAVFAHQLPNWHCTLAQEDNIINVPPFFKSLSGVVSLCYKIMSIQGGLEVYLTRMFMCSKIAFDLTATSACRRSSCSGML